MQFIEVFWNYLVLSAPYLLVGLFLSGIIHVLIPIEKVQKWLGGNKVGSIFRASLIGVPLPLCSCSVIPTAVTLKKSGANNAATSAFLISTPESGIDSISLTYALMDLPMTILRPIAAFSSAVIAGIFQLVFNKDEVLDMNSQNETSHKHHEHDKEKSKNIFLSSFKYAYGKLSDDISVWLMVGIILGAMINYFLPSDFFLNYTQDQGRFLILILGIPLYICATASTPIALSLILKGLSPGSALLLLLVGPATNIANIAVLQKYIGKRGVIINILSIAIVGLVFSYLTDFLYSHYFVNNFKSSMTIHDHELTAWWEHLCAALLMILLLKGIYNEKLKHYFVKKKKSCCH